MLFRSYKKYNPAQAEAEAGDVMTHAGLEMNVKEEGRKLKNFLPSFILFKGVIYMVMEACFASSFCSLPFSVWHIAPLPIA